METTLAIASAPDGGTHTEVPLDQLAAEINQAHGAAECGMRESLLHAKLAGEKLREAKAIVGYGSFMEWCAENFSFSNRTAALYMAVAANWGELESANSQSIANLSLSDAARYLAAAKREVNAEERAKADWHSTLTTSKVHNSANRVLKELNAFAECLRGGRVYECMGDVVESHPTVLDDPEIEKLVHAFQQCGQEVKECVEALRRRLDRAQVTWRKAEGASLLTFLEETKSPNDAADA